VSAIEKGVQVISRRISRSADARRLLRLSNEADERIKLMDAEIARLKASESEAQDNFLALSDRVTALESR